MNLKILNLNELKKILGELVPIDEVIIKPDPQLGPYQPDFIAEVVFKDYRFKLVGEVTHLISSSIFHHVLTKLKAYAEYQPELLPILITKYLSPEKRKECKNQGIYYLDLSGNVYLKYEGIYIERTGFPNRFPESRRGRNPFSDKASLILRTMLQNKKLWGVRELARITNLDAGYVSRLLKELEKLNYVLREKGKAKLIDRKHLLEDWVHNYHPRRNKEFRYFLQAQNPESILDKLRNLDIPQHLKYALGYQAGAYLVSPHAVFNEVHIYVPNEESIDYFCEKLNLRPVDQGANLIFLLPFYRYSVFYDMRKVKGLWGVSDLQLYLDLYSYPLRGIEQAEYLYKKRLKKIIEE